MNIHLLIIDPQNDFCDPSGSLFVKGADEDMKRLGEFIKNKKKKLSDIHVTLDSHHFVDVAHPIYWMDSKGNHPAPFTPISAADVLGGVWRTTNPGLMDDAKNYVKTLEKNGRYPLVIWPPHCLIGSPGYAVYPEVFKSLLEWESDMAIVDYVTKGSNYKTEHYSAVQADVPDPEDPGTQINQRLISLLQDEADMVLLAGEALSHCVANTVKDIADNFGEDNIKKMYLLQDCTSSVETYEALGTQFVSEMQSRGMNVTTSKDILS